MQVFRYDENSMLKRNKEGTATIIVVWNIPRDREFILYGKYKNNSNTARNSN